MTRPQRVHSESPLSSVASESTFELPSSKRPLITTMMTPPAHRTEQPRQKRTADPATPFHFVSGSRTWSRATAAIVSAVNSLGSSRGHRS